MYKISNGIKIFSFTLILLGSIGWTYSYMESHKTLDQVKEMLAHESSHGSSHSDETAHMEKANEDIETLSARLISLEEAAELIKIKKGTLQNWLSQGSKFKRVKIGGRTFIDRLELENLLQVALSGK